MADPLHVPDLVEAQIEAGQLRQRLEAADVRDEVVVEVQLAQLQTEAVGEDGLRDPVLSQAQSLSSVSVLTVTFLLKKINK